MGKKEVTVTSAVGMLKLPLIGKLAKPRAFKTLT